MEIRRLIELLEEYADEYGDDAPVMVQYQPSYPLKAQVEGVVSEHDIQVRVTEDRLAEDRQYGEIDADELTRAYTMIDAESPVVYLLASEGAGYGANPYGDRVAWEVAQR